MTNRVAHRPAALTNPVAIYATGLLGMGYADFYMFLIPFYALSLGMSAGEIGVLVGRAICCRCSCRSMSAS